MSLPKKVLELLKTEKLCSLGTSCQGQPHVSLMCFTYLEKEGMVILGSSPRTTKVENIKHNPKVSLLIYNMTSLGGEYPMSCTLHGTAAIVDTSQDQYFKDKHHQNNPHMVFFTTGDKIVIITVTIERSILSDATDRVWIWSAK